MEDFLRRRLLFIEGEGEGEGGAGGPSGESSGGGEPNGAGSADDWRDIIEDQQLREHANRFSSIPDVVGKHYELRQQLSTAIQPLPKEPTDEQIASYRKAMGVPDSVEGYEFTLPEGQEPTERDKEFQAAAAETFHKFNVTAEQAKGITEWFNQAATEALERQVAADKEYAEETIAALKREWPGAEFEKNKAFADSAANKLFGENLDEIRNIETKDGRFVLDHPAFVKVFAQYGREMEEGTLGGVMTETDRTNIQEEIEELDKKIYEAQAGGDQVKANDLYIQQQELFRKMHGSGPIVGSEGRSA